MRKFGDNQQLIPHFHHEPINLNVGIIGLGYVGLPTAIGFRVLDSNGGVDLSDRIVNSLLQEITLL